MARESEIIELARNGNRSAERQLFDAHVDQVYRFMAQFSRSQFELEEWVQRAFIKAFAHLHQFDGRSAFRSWLTRIAINEMKSDRRRKDVVLYGDPPVGDHPPVAEPEVDFGWHDTMRQWLASMDETKRMVFILYEVEGYSHGEIAGMMDIEESTSRSLLSRARAFLRTQWKMEEQRV